MKDFDGRIQFKDKEFRMVFNLNVMEKIQEEYGSIEQWAELTDRDEPDIKAIKFGFCEMLNEGIDMENEENGMSEPFLTMKQVGRMVSDLGFGAVREKVSETVIGSTQSAEKNA